MNTSHLVAVAAAASTIAFAAPAALAEPQSGFFAVASIGDTDIHYRPQINDVIADSTRTFELGIGYAINPNISIQGSYHDYGNPIGYAGCPPEVLCILAFSPEEVEVDGWSATVVGTLPISNKFAVFGKLGMMAWDTDARSSSLNDSGEDLIYAAGISWNLSERWGIQLSYEELDLDFRSSKLGAMFRF
jgi:OOP family OmpA-OmpF porin